MKKEVSLRTSIPSGGSLPLDCRRQRPSEHGGARFKRSVPPAPRFDTPETEAALNQYRRHLRPGAVLQKLPWQIRETALITIVGPPAASLILLTREYFEYWRDVPFNLADFLAVFLLFATPVGYVFGAVPALLAASLYCALVTAHPGLLQQRPWTRAGVAGICGGLVTGAWFSEQLATAWGIYALAGALVMIALSPRAAFARRNANRFVHTSNAQSAQLFPRQE